MAQGTKKQSAHHGLARQMLQVLEAQKRLGGSAYPLTIKRLAELTDPSATEQSVFKAIRTTNIFMSHAIAAHRHNVSAPVALLHDVTILAQSPLTLDFAFDQIKTTTRIVTVAKLKVRLTSRSEFQQLFQSAVNRMLAGQLLPVHIGWIAVGRSPGLFRLQDLHPTVWREHLRSLASGSAPPSISQTVALPELATSPRAAIDRRFAEHFDTIFQRLDAQKGSHNLVTLYDLRRELSDYTREQFDLELRKLRLADRYSLSAAESRRGIPVEQRESGITEAGSLLLYVSRSSS